MQSKPNEWVISYVLNKLSAKYPDITREEVIAEWNEMNGMTMSVTVAKEERKLAKVV